RKLVRPVFPAFKAVPLAERYAGTGPHQSLRRNRFRTPACYSCRPAGCARRSSARRSIRRVRLPLETCVCIWVVCTRAQGKGTRVCERTFGTDPKTLQEELQPATRSKQNSNNNLLSCSQTLPAVQWFLVRRALRSACLPPAFAATEFFCAPPPGSVAVACLRSNESAAGRRAWVHG